MSALPALETDVAARTAITRLLIEATGMVTLDGRSDEIAAAAERRRQQLGLGDLEAYAAWLEREESPWPEREALVEQLTIGETYFMRHPEVFAALRDEILPGLLSPERTLQVWSAACSIGCEPYSLAITLEDTAAALAFGPAVHILATDINSAFLERARRGHYSRWSLRNLSPEWIQQHFEVQGEEFVLRPRYKRHVSFRRCNLADFSPSTIGPDGSIDLIFCRNVMIYFGESTVRDLAARFLQLLRPGGWLVLGASECNTEIFAPFEAHNYDGAVFYRKPEVPPVQVTQTAPAQPPLRRPKPPRRPPRVASAPTTPAPRGFDGVWALLEAGQWSEAAALARDEDALGSLDASLHFAQGLAAEKMEQATVAEAAYRRCLYLDRNHAPAQARLALLLATDPRRSQPASKALRLAERLLADESADRPIPSGFPPTAELRRLVSEAGKLHRA